MRKAKTVTRLPVSTTMLSILIWKLLWPVRLVTLIVPIRHLTRFLGEDRGTSAIVAEPAAEQELHINRIATAIDIATRHHPLNNTCYAQALIAHQLLKRRSVAHVINFGVRRDGAGAKMEAHAWVMAGSTAISGGHCSQEYTIVRCFVSEQKPA